MAKMVFREQNQVLWRGVRPAHEGTQIVERTEANNNVVLIHNVSAGTTLFLCTVGLSTYDNIQGKGAAYILDDGANYWVDLLRFYHHLNTTISPGIINFWPPLEVPTDYDIYVSSSALGLNVQGYIFGWEE